ncbi:MAG: class I SAM-dependent methyltransferase [Clostridia bacterium]|nr:class I SAM-dependent methyltransferase [Clostridia bacterium]
MIRLSPRLSMTADMVRRSSRVADIGTDHAYLPCSLIISGKIPGAVAADLRSGPLENAKATVLAAGLSDKVELRISDGLSSVMPDEADDFVIAGMGGNLIADILSKSDLIYDKSKRLILQPQSHDEDVRKFLWENGFEIKEERICFEGEKVYIAFAAEYTGKICKHSEAEILLGGYYKLNSPPAKAFTDKKLKRLRTRAEALKLREPDSEEIKKADRIIKEVSQWQR